MLRTHRAAVADIVGENFARLVSSLTARLVHLSHAFAELNSTGFAPARYSRARCRFVAHYRSATVAGFHGLPC